MLMTPKEAFKMVTATINYKSEVSVSEVTPRN